MSSSSFALSERGIASLFDIFAEDSLRASLKPAWDFVCRFLASRYPTTHHLIATLKYSDEIYLVLLLVMEEYNLRHNAASMTEHFYQLKRESTSLHSSFLFRKAKLISLLSVVVLPYLLNKLEKYYERIKERVAVASNTNGLAPMERLIYKWYPVLLLFTKWMRMFNYLLFLFNYTKYAFPLLTITQMQLKYDIPSLVGTHPKKGEDLNSTKKRLLWSLVTKPFDFLSYGLTKMAPVFFYSLSFLDTFYQDDFWAKTSMIASKLEPPQNSKVAMTCV